MFRNRWLIALGAIAMAFVFVSADAHARVGGGFSGGSRGMRTFSAPPATSTAPTAAPIERSITQPATSRPTARLGSVRTCSAAACSADLLLASSAQVYLACCSGTDFSVAWRALPQ